MASVPIVHTVPEASRLLRLSESYTWRLISSGELPHRRVGNRVLVTDDDLAEFCDAHRAA